MSTLLGMESGNAVFHMTTDERSQAQLKTGPVSTTTFHSDLPYVLVREQFELTSYTQWSGADGGRKFALGQDLIDFRSDNTDLAYLLILEDSSGNSWVHDPLINVRGSWNRVGVNGQAAVNEVVFAGNGGDYQVAFTDSDSQLANLTKNTLGTTFDWVFETWDNNDTDITIFRAPVTLGVRDSKAFVHPSYSYQHDNSFLKWFTNAGVVGGTDLESVNLDVVKVRFAFLNVTHSSSTFELQKGFSKDEIKISPNEFSVHQINLAKMIPLISHGTKASGSTITAIGSCEVVSGKGANLSLTSAKIDNTNQIINASAPVLEIPPSVGTLTGWDIDFSSRAIKRNGIDVWTDSIAAHSIGVLGKREIDFSPSLTLTNATVTQTISSNSTGSLGNVDSDTLYLASIVSGSDKLHSVSVMSAGDNLLADLVLGKRQSLYDAARSQWSNNVQIYLVIDSSGNTTIKVFWEPGIHSQSQGFYNSYWNISSVSVVIPDFKIRLISVGNLGQ